MSPFGRILNTGCVMLLVLSAAPAAAQTFIRAKTDTGERPIAIESMSMKASVKGLHALVDTEFVFKNPNARVMEGELEFPLPDGASVSGYAIDVNGAMVDGVVVMKEKARVVFETEARRGVDPGLVEHVKGNLYRTRIYPLPAGGTRRVRISYTTPLAIAPDGDAALRLSMPKTSIGKSLISIEVVSAPGNVPTLGGLGDRRFERAENVWRVSAEETNTTPGQDVLVALPRLPAEFALTERDNEGAVWFMASVKTPIAAARAVSATAFDVYWDASASREGPGLNLDFAFIDKLPATASYNLVVFRDVPEQPVACSSRAELIEKLKKVKYDGGTSLEFLASRKASQGVPAMIFTDGIDTLGSKIAANLPTVLVSSAVSDMETLRQASGGAVIDLRTMNAEQAAGLFFSPSEKLTGLDAAGVADVLGVGQGATGRAFVIGRLIDPTTQVTMKFAAQNASTITVSAAAATSGSTLRKAWAAMRVAQLAPRADDFADELLSLGRKYGVVSPATTLLVLESLDQWVRYEIEPPATLPEMRNDWRAAMKGRTQDDGEATEAHLAQLEKEWKDRIEWLRRDFKKNPFKTTVMEGGAGMGIGVGMGMRGTGSSGGGIGASPSIGMSIGGSGGGDGAARPPAPEERHERATESAVDYDEAEEVNATRDSEAKKSAAQDGHGASAIEVTPWDPATPYMQDIRAAAADRQYETYLDRKTMFAGSPAFYLDVAEHFFRAGQAGLATRILTNLAEMKIEDAALLRVLAWRLRQEKQYEMAVVQFRRIVKLRGEDPQSWRDLAVTLSEWGKATHSRARLEEAMNLFVKVAFTPWQRHADTISIFALEELNALITWIDAAKFKVGDKPVVPDFDKKFRAALSTDLRIYIAWDADNTDIDLHVMEPSGEEAYYSNNRTSHGGLVSRDITDGYGPEEYMIARAPAGEYAISANYYGSRQQTIMGPATVTATIFTDWGRADERQQTISIRLDTPNDNVPVGKVKFGKGGKDSRPSSGSIGNLTTGMTVDEVDSILGSPIRVNGGQRDYDGGSDTVIKALFDPEGKLTMAARHFPGGAIMILVQ